MYLVVSVSFDKLQLENFIVPVEYTSSLHAHSSGSEFRADKWSQFYLLPHETKIPELLILNF